MDYWSAWTIREGASLLACSLLERAQSLAQFALGAARESALASRLLPARTRDVNESPGTCNNPIINHLSFKARHSDTRTQQSLTGERRDKCLLVRAPRWHPKVSASAGSACRCALTISARARLSLVLRLARERASWWESEKRLEREREREEEEAEEEGLRGGFPQCGNLFVPTQWTGSKINMSHARAARQWFR